MRNTTYFLKASHELESDHQLFKKCLSREMQRNKYTTFGSGIGYHDTPYLKVYYMLQMKVYAATAAMSRSTKML